MESEVTKESRKTIEFVSVRETKATHSGHRVYKFFLVDKEGNEHLAATGEETADAHYNYQSTAEFSSYGTVCGHSRKDLTMWLEQVIKESGQAARGEVLDADHVVHLGQPTTEDPLGTYFVNYRQERTHLADGRRCNQWWLVDQHGQEHLAVVGTERETRDAHYTYYATEAFVTEHPLECNNQGKVLKWIESMLTHRRLGQGFPLPIDGDGTPNRLLGGMTSSALGISGNVDPSGGVTASQHEGAESQPTPDQGTQAYTTGDVNTTTANGAGNSGVASPGDVVAATTALSAQARPFSGPCTSATAEQQGPLTLGRPPRPVNTGSRLGKPPGAVKSGPSKTGSKHKLVGIAQDAHLKRLRRLAAETEEAVRAAQAAHMVRLRRAAEVETASIEAVRRNAAHWLRDVIGTNEEELLSQWHETLKQLWSDAQKDQFQHVTYTEVYLDPHLNELLDKAQRVDLQAQDGPSNKSYPTITLRPASSPELPLPITPTEDGQLQQPSPSAIHSTQHTAQTWTYSDPHLNAHGVRIIMECLREVGAMLLPMQAMLSSGVIDTVRAYAQGHPHPLVSKQAQLVLGVWQRAVLSHMRAIALPRNNPVSELEAKIAAGQIFQEVPQTPMLTPGISPGMTPAANTPSLVHSPLFDLALPAPQGNDVQAG